MSFINSKNLDMREEENRDVVVEGGTVISCSSMVVKQRKLKEGAMDANFRAQFIDSVGK